MTSPNESIREIESNIEEYARAFFEDGIVYLPQVLNGRWMHLIETGVNRNMVNPGPFHKRHYPGDPDREFYDDYLTYNTNQEYQIFLRDSPLVSLLVKIMKTSHLWLFFDQIFIKEGGRDRRTPWHQDTTYFCAAGSQLSCAWITLDSLDKSESLEFVKGSHRGPLYAGMTWNPADDRDPYFKDWEPLPDIDGDRGSFDIVSFDTRPGDVLFFHPSILHGGAASNGQARRLSLRLFGDDAVLDSRPDDRCAPPFPGLFETHEVGKPLRGPWFQPLYPVAHTPLLPPR